MYKATELFKHYTNAVLGLDVKDFRALQAGKAVNVKKEIVDKYPYLFEQDKKEKVDKNGDSE